MGGKQQPDSAQSDHLPSIGGYEIIEKIGEGAVGVVYKARQLSVGRIVALKLLSPRYAGDPSFIERFLQEAKAVGQLHHPNIVLGIDAGQTAEGCYFVMEYVEGETVKQALRRCGAVPQKQAIDIVMRIAQALRHAAKIKLVHRDIKPENIMITKDGVAKLADLGLAKTSIGDSTATSGGAGGTPMYISPEQAKGGEDLDVRTDIYSLGATLFHMVAGVTPFSGENPTSVMLKHINEEPPSPRDFKPELRPALCAVIRKMMEKDPAARYQTAKALIEDLQAVSAGKRPLHTTLDPNDMHQRAPALAPVAAKSSSRTSTIMLIAGFVALAVAFAFYQFYLNVPPAVQPDEQVKIVDAPPPPDDRNGNGDAAPAGPSDEEKMLGEMYAVAAAHDAAEEAEAALAAYSDFTAVAAEHEELAASEQIAPLLEKARARIAEIEQKMEAARALAEAQEAFAELLQQVEAAGTNYGRAIELAGAFIEAGDLHDEIAPQAVALLEKLREDARTTAEGIREQARLLLEAADYGEARAAFAQLEHLGIEEYATWAADGATAVDEAIRAKKQDEELAYKRFLTKFAGLLRERTQQEAGAFAAESLRLNESDYVKGEIEWDMKFVDHLNRFENDVKAALAALEGRDFEIFGRTAVTIRRVTDTTVTVVRSGVEMPPRRIDRLPATDKLKLARFQWERTGAEEESTVIIYHLVNLDIPAARAALRAVDLDVSDKQRFDARILYLESDARAQELYNSAVVAARHNRHDQLNDAVTKLLHEYNETWVVSSNREQIETWSREVIEIAD